MTRILIVDDSSVMRKLLREAIATDSMFDVQTAANGKIALAMIGQTRPDLIVLDIEMPEMNGLDTLVRIRQIDTSVPVIMFSTLTERGAEATIDSLMRGASDYVTKPSNSQGVSFAVEVIRQQLMPKIRNLCGGASRPSRAVEDGLSPPKPGAIANHAKKHSAPIRVLAIGSSTGGPNALAELVGHLPENLPVPTVIVQHMPPVFTRFLAERLNAISNLTVQEAKGGETLSPGQVWLAPGDYHLVLKQHGVDVKLETNHGPQENSCRPSVDVLFRSVAAAYPGCALAAILTGMGQDGLEGARSLVASGSTILAQDEATSVVWGMPGFVTRAGLASKVLPLSELASELAIQIRKSRESLPKITDARRGQIQI